VQSCLLLFVGALTGPIFDAGYFRTLINVGSFLVVFGLFMTSIAREFWQMLLAQGFCVGIGMGCLFTPSVALVATYFSTKLMPAMGVAAMGSGIGGTIFPVIFHKLQPDVGFRWATRSVAFISLATLAVPILVMKVRVLPPTRRRLFDQSAWLQADYSLYVLGGFVTFLGTWTPYFYIGLYTYEQGAASAETAFYILAIIGAGTVVGRLGPPMLAAKVGMYNVLIPCTFLTGIMAFSLIGAKSLGPIIVIAVLYGIFTGAVVTILPTLPTQLCPDRAVVGNRMGMAFAVASWAVVSGPPIAGNLLRNHGYDAAFGFAGAAGIAGALVLMMSRGFHGGWVVMKKM
jgi:MFS family permease